MSYPHPMDDVTGFEGDEPEAKCRNCEYFDGSGLAVDGTPIQDHGDCLNRNSPFFTTSGDKTCGEFFPCSTRWPNADHG